MEPMYLDERTINISHWASQNNDSGSLTQPYIDNDTFGNMLLHSNGCPERARFYINTVIAGTICVFGFTGNVLAFVVLSSDKDSPLASFLLKVLACVDNFFLGMWMLHFSISNLFTYLQIDQRLHSSWLYIRVYTYPLLFMGQTATIWMIVLIAISRFIAVCVPYRAAQYNTLPNVYKASIAIITFSVVYNVPRYFETTINALNINGSTTYTFERTRFGNMLIYGILYFDSLYIIFNFVLPLLMLVFLNTKLILAYKRIQIRRHSLTVRRQDRQDQNITLVMIVIILVFILCNAPARIVQIIWGYQPQPCISTEFVLMEISNVLEVLNSSANFIVYCVFRPQFRIQLKRRLCPTHMCRDTNSDIAMTEHISNGRLTTNSANHNTEYTKVMSNVESTEL